MGSVTKLVTKLEKLPNLRKKNRYQAEKYQVDEFVGKKIRYQVGYQVEKNGRRKKNSLPSWGSKIASQVGLNGRRKSFVTKSRYSSC